MREEKNAYILDLNHLTTETENVGYKIGKSFFDSFENKEVLDADCTVDIAVTKGLGATRLDISIEGTITVPCDRCMEDAEFPVDYQSELFVKLSDSVEDSYWDNDGEDEILWINTSVAEADLRQYLYDSIMLSLPIQRIHEEDDCNEIIKKYITVTE